jgi:hypothetical protein
MSKIYCPYSDEVLEKLKARARELYDQLSRDGEEIRLDGDIVGRVIYSEDLGYLGLRLVGEKYTPFPHTFERRSHAIRYTKRQISFGRAVTEILTEEEYAKLVDALWNKPPDAILIDDYVALKHLNPKPTE